jgi:hypothetical protein
MTLSLDYSSSRKEKEKKKSLFFFITLRLCRAQNPHRDRQDKEL